MMNPDLTTSLIGVRKLIGLTVFRRIRAFIEQDNLLASSTALSLAKLAVEYHHLSMLTPMRDDESENVRVARHLHGQFSSVDQRTFMVLKMDQRCAYAAKPFVPDLISRPWIGLSSKASDRLWFRRED